MDLGEIISSNFIKILILVYDSGVAHMMQIALAAEGFATMGTTEDSIFKDISTFQPHLIILESKLDSLTTEPSIFQQINAKHFTIEVPIVLVSSVHELNEYAEINEANAYIIKPVDYTDLCNTVKDVLSL